MASPDSEAGYRVSHQQRCQFTGGFNEVSLTPGLWFGGERE